ncbi:Gfo/Idh/MocA family oxidoreductase [Bacteroides sp.]|uniref:Gfo/Idh/MocA family protein n=1 Tax=Bacteroides sp. TaxID=29523 RepID=UPI002628294A|nr:Gfo/Idh/MocA family oxidoreductase [Bacteroides sp.]MDD3039687.1 Gfo/Idh/MocA family oxidoreductase [Bacteroides sp.]
MTTRREFLKKMGAMAATGLVMPTILSENNLFARSVAANDKINIALIGCRGMGWSNLNDFLIHPEVECVALCDIDKSILENKASELVKMRSGKPELYGDYRKLLERKDIDAVIIGTPDHWHCLQMVDACSAGKDVYVEKPLANSIAECDAMVAAAKKYNRVVQVGQQQRSGNHWHEMKKYIDSGKLGKIAKVNVWANFGYATILNPVPDSPVPAGIDFETWLGPAPKRTFNEKRFHGSWRMFWDYGGGLMTDWGVHLMDMALWGMNVNGMPNRILSSGGNFAYPENYAETFDTLSVVYEFDDFTIQWSNVSIEAGPYGRNYGVEFIGTNGILVANRESWEVYPVQNKIEAIKSMPNYQDHRDHVTNFLNCMKTREMNTACTVDNGSLCAKYAHLGNISARVRSALVYDDVKKTFNHREANKLIKPDYRKPWKFPEL